jgi:hypothetical protein
MISDRFPMYGGLQSNGNNKSGWIYAKQIEELRDRYAPSGIWITTTFSQLTNKLSTKVFGFDSSMSFFQQGTSSYNAGKVEKHGQMDTQNE